MRNTLLSEYIFTSVARWKRFPFRVSPQVPECEKVIYGKKIKLGWGGGVGGGGQWRTGQYIYFLCPFVKHIYFSSDRLFIVEA
jgi:hypothetical protein